MKLNLEGKVFGKLTVIDKAEIVKHPNGKTSTKWNCRCECGNSTRVVTVHLTSKRTRSCGCLRGRETRHGDSGCLEHVSWKAMRSRCLNPKNKAFKDYGGRGIKICARWLESYENFLADMGRRPSSKHSIHRIDNDGNYEPSNCKWATSLEQSDNKRSLVILEITGLRQSAKRWAEDFDLKPSILYRRLKRGWTPYDAVTIPAGGKGNGRFTSKQPA